MISGGVPVVEATMTVPALRRGTGKENASIFEPHCVFIILQVTKG
jgi:hypothetical protein